MADRAEEAETEVRYHHFSLTFEPREVASRLSDVRFLLVAGCWRRAQAQANYLAERLFNGRDLEALQAERLTSDTSRFSLFKVGPVLVSDHGMGAASMSIALHELFLMCRQAGVMPSLTVIRFGTCKCAGIDPQPLVSPIN